MRKPKKLEVTYTNRDGDSYTSELYRYNEHGNTIENIDFEEEGIVQNKIISKFDDQNRLLEEVVFADGEIMTEHKKHIRKEDGSLDRIEINYQDGSTSVQYMKKDEEKNTEEWIEEDEDGELESREVIQNDVSGKIIKREVFDYRNKLKEAFEFSYGNNGDLVERKELDHKRKLVFVTEFEYDENKNLTYRANRNRKGVLSDFIKTFYDDKGQVIRQNISGKYAFEFEYDSEGRTVLEERYLPNDEMEFQSRFEYDEDGRMTSEINLNFTKTYKYEFFE